MPWCHETIDDKQVATGPKTGTRVKSTRVPAKISIGGVAQILRTRAVLACDLGRVKKFQ